MKQIEIDIRTAPDFAYSDSRWAWLAVSRGVAVGVLVVRDTQGYVDDQGVEWWKRHGTVTYVHSAITGHKISLSLLRHGQSTLLHDHDLTLFRSGTATAGGKAVTTHPTVDLEISPKAECLYENAMNKFRRRPHGTMPQLEHNLDDAKALNDSTEILRSVAQSLSVAVYDSEDCNDAASKAIE